MGYWQGAALGEGMAADRAMAELNKVDQQLAASRGNVAAFKKANDELIELVNKYGYDADVLRIMQKSVVGDEAGQRFPIPGALYFAVFAETRPDKISKDAPINTRRAKNLEIIAWAECVFMSTIACHNLARQNAPKVGTLSELVEGGVFDGKAVAASLRDIAGKMETSSSAYYTLDAGEWVEKRISELREVAKFKKGDSMPVPESVAPTDPLLQNIESHKRPNGKFNVVLDDTFTISDIIR